MNHFMVRVALRQGPLSGNEADFLHLSLAMEAEGFSHLIKGSSGTAFQLPPGEYYFAGEIARDEVLARAKKCAAKITRGYAVLITQGEAFMWCGLKKANARLRTEGAIA